MKNRIKNTLQKALLENGEMSMGLYEFDMQEHIDEWINDTQNDNDDYCFFITENRGDVAMVLISRENEIFINEKAREKLMKLWIKAYDHNIKLLLPTMTRNLSNGFFAITGVKTSNQPTPTKS
ncbi:MAG: hypothetical protein JSS64_05920 [Bacteroidetes bacterium]|nr:hypothetical protein [Bacteroidota bacterium]